MVLSVFYYGGMMMTESQLSVGDLSAFLLYAAYIGLSIGGNLCPDRYNVGILWLTPVFSLTDTMS